MLRRKIFYAFAALALLVAAGSATEYVRWVGHPKVVAGRWVFPHIATWYWTGMPGWPYPAVIQYGYRDQHGTFVLHGPYIRRIWTSTARGYRPATDESGFYLDGQKDGVFIKYQTFWGSASSREYYQHGKLVRVEFFNPVPQEFLVRLPKP